MGGAVESGHRAAAAMRTIRGSVAALDRAATQGRALDELARSAHKQDAVNEQSSHGSV